MTSVTSGTHLPDEATAKETVADEALSDMVADSQYFGDYDVDPEAVHEALAHARHGADQ